MDTHRTDLSEMVTLAKVFCAQVEHPDESPTRWVQELAHLLPRLQAAVVGLHEQEEAKPLAGRVDPDARFELFSRLAQRLGDLDGYRLEFDDLHQDAQLTGSLADDLTDIYFDLREGLNWIARADPEHAESVWRHSYRVHWGQHLVDANRHLYAINSRLRGAPRKGDAGQFHRVR